MIRILLQFDDAYFIKAFSDYASAYCRDMEFLCFTTPQKAKAYLAATALRMDAVLAQQEVLDAVQQPGTARLLASDRTVFADENGICINLYQSGPAIFSDIKSALALTGNNSLYSVNGRSVHVVAAYSAQGGGGKTTLSYALAVAAARQNRQAMYLNLEPFPALSQLYEHAFVHSMDDLLLPLKSGRDLAPVLLDTMERNRDGVLVLPPFSSAGDLLSITQEELQTLIHTLVEKTDVEYIFVDLPTGFHPLNLWALEQCTTVLQVYSDDLAGHEHRQRAENDVYYKNLPIRGNLLTVMNKCPTKAPADGVDCKLPNSESLQQGRRVADVLERNPAFLKNCTDLLEKLS